MTRLEGSHTGPIRLVCRRMGFIIGVIALAVSFPRSGGNKRCDAVHHSLHEQQERIRLNRPTVT